MLHRVAVLVSCGMLLGATPIPHETADQQMQAVYETLKTRLQNDTPHRRQLTNTQRSWRAFRDAECEFVSRKARPSDVHIETYQDCLQDMALVRYRVLQHYLHCAETGTDCTVAPRP